MMVLYDEEEFANRGSKGISKWVIKVWILLQYNLKYNKSEYGSSKALMGYCFMSVFFFQSIIKGRDWKSM